MIWRSRNYPLIGGAFFQLAAVMQIVDIVVAKDAGSVSAAAWAISALILLGYIGFYRVHMSAEARVAGIVASLISAALYAAITILTFVY